MQAKRRIISLDLIRSVAIFLVVLTHASDKSYVYFTLDIIPKLSSLHRIFAIILHILGRSGVPLFLYLTGYLLIDRDYDNEKALEFRKKHLVPLIITSSIWGCIYFIYNMIVDKRPFSLSRLLTELFFYQQYEGTQFWYVPVIIGIYLFIPVVGIALKHLDERYCLPLGVFSFLYISIPPTLNPILASVKSSFQLTAILDLSFSGGCYGLYILMGYYAKKNQKRANSLAFISSATVSFLFLVWELNFCYMHGVVYDLWYDNSALAVLSYSLFVLLLNIRTVKLAKYVTGISQNAFGIYLVHNLFIMYLSKHVLRVLLWKKFLILFVASSTLSVIFVLLIGRNRTFAKYLIYQK